MHTIAESSTFSFFRTLQKKVLYSATTLLLAATGCPSSCDTSHHIDPPTPAVWNATDATPPLIPNEVEWAVQGKPKELRRILHIASHDVTPNHIPPLLKQLLQLNLPPKDNPNSLESLGFNENSLVTIVHAHQDTILAFRHPDPSTLDSTIDSWNLRKSIKMRSSEVLGNKIYLTWTDTPNSEYLFTVVQDADNSWVFVSLPNQLNRENAAAQRKAITHFGEILHNWSTLPGERWGDRFQNLSTEKANYFNKLSAYATARLDLLLSEETEVSPLDPPHTVQSKKLKKQLVDELHEFELFAILDPEETHLSLTIEQSKSKDNKDSPFSSLGVPSGKFPYFSTLAPAGTLGIIHLAFEPQTLFNFITSLLPSDSRELLSARLNEYLVKADLNVQQDLIDNINGHTIVFIYGLANDTFQQIAHGSLADILLLKYARKALLIPLKNTTQTVEFLDISTQLFKDNFVRKGIGLNNIEYIWHDGDEVKWGILVKDNALIYVDSYAAYQHALAYDNTSVATLPEFNNHDNNPILVAENRFQKNDHDAAILLDTDSIETLLSQDSYYAEWAEWLAPYSSAIIVSSMSNNRTILELDLTIRKPTSLSTGDNDIAPLHLLTPPKTTQNEPSH